MSDRERLDAIERLLDPSGDETGAILEVFALARKAMDERDEARGAVKGLTDHLVLADEIVNEAINEAAGAVAGMPDGRPGDRVAAVVSKMARAERAEAELARLRPVVEAAKAWKKAMGEGFGINDGVNALWAAVARAESDEKEGAK